MANVLCIFCYRRVFILDMDKILNDEDYKEGTSPKRPPVKRIFDFLESRLPLGMGLLKCGNFLYMFGGEYPDPIDDVPHIENSDPHFEIAERPRVMGYGIPNENPPCPVFSLDLTCDHSEPVPLRSMLGPKLYPVVEQIGGQIYVLSDRLLSSTLPMFEVWNPMTEEWRALPNPPPFPNGYSSRIMCHCVCGRDIICALGLADLYRFSTVSETWECIEELSSREDMAMYGSFDVRSEDVYLGQSRETEWCMRNDTLWAMVDGPDPKDGYSVAVDSSKTRPHLPDSFDMADDAVLANTSELGNYMCGLTPYVDGKGFLLYVFVFQVEKLGSGKVPPLAVKYLRRQVYDFTYLKYRNEELPAHIISKAVIGRLSHNTSTGRGECSREEAKRKREEVDDDADQDEGQAVLPPCRN